MSRRRRHAEVRPVVAARLTGWHLASVRLGVRAALPLSVAAFPFGLVYGVAVTTSTVPDHVGVAASWIILAGAAQLTVLRLIDEGAGAAVVIGTALVINARFALYSAALAPAFKMFPRRWRVTLPYLLTDQAASLALRHDESEADPVRRRSFFLGAALLFATGWWLGTVVGVIGAGSIPDDLDLGFAVPAMFIALVVPAVVDRPSFAAAVVGASVAVAAAPTASPSVTGWRCGGQSGWRALASQAWWPTVSSRRGSPCCAASSQWHCSIWFREVARGESHRVNVGVAA